MTLEDRLERLANRTPQGDPADVLAGARARAESRPDARNPRLLAAAAVAILALVAGAFATLTEDGDDPTRVDTVDDPTTSVTSQPTSTTSPASTSSTATTEPDPAVAGAEVSALELPTGAPLGPDELAVALFREGGADPGTNDLAVISALDGSVLRTLDAAGVSEGGIMDIAVSGDRRTILTTQGTSACTGPVRAYPADGSGDIVEYDQFANALLIAVSADGSLLAVSSDDDCDGHHTLTLWPVGSGAGTAYVFGDGGGDLAGLPAQVDGGQAVHDETLPSLRSIAFAADGSLSYVTSSDGEHAAYRLPAPTEPAVRYEGARAVMPSGGTTDATLLDFARGPDDQLVVSAETGSGLVLGELAAGQTAVENVVPVDDDIHDIGTVGPDKMWVTTDRHLFRFLETSAFRLRTDVVQVGT